MNRQTQHFYRVAQIIKEYKKLLDIFIIHLEENEIIYLKKNPFKIYISTNEIIKIYFSLHLILKKCAVIVINKENINKNLLIYQFRKTV